MNRLKKLTALLCAASITVFSGCGAAITEMPEGTGDEEQTAVIPDHIRAQDDFFGYVNLETLRNAEFKYGESVAGSAFDQNLIEDQVKSVINDVISGNGYPVGTEEYVIKTAYDLFSSYDFDNAAVPASLDSLLHEIDEASTIDELLEIDVRIQRDWGCNGILNLAVTPNYLESGTNVLSFGQYSGLFDADFESLDESYSSLDSLKEKASIVLQAMGHDKDYSENTGKEFAYIVMDLYNATDMDIARSTANQYEYFKIYSADSIKDILTNVELDGYLNSLGFDLKYCDEFGLMDPGQLAKLNEIIVAENIDVLKTWELCSVCNTFQRFIVNGYDAFDQYKTVDYSSDEDRVMNEILMVYSSQTDPLYVESYYSSSTDSALISMCDDIKEGYRELISSADWLSSGSRSSLLEKLDNIIYVTGSDMTRQDPDEYKEVRGRDYFEFYLAYKIKDIRDQIGSLGKPLDRKDIQMPMQMFNACYDPSLNNITITVAITNAPFFDVKADYYTNLGGLGMVIAHEMGHAFDSNCILFDQDGVYNPSWISSADVDKLNDRNVQAIDYFENKFTVFGVYHVDGEQTLGENYADLGGMECIVSLTENDDQRKLLFENYARIWCEKKEASALLDQIEYDAHSPEVIRVNAILSAIDEFYTTYHVSPSDGMYIAPNDRISRWH